MADPKQLREDARRQREMAAQRRSGVVAYGTIPPEQMDVMADDLDRQADEIEARQKAEGTQL